MALFFCLLSTQTRGNDLINIGIYEVDCASFQVRLKPDADIGSGITNIQFSIKWPAETVGVNTFTGHHGVGLDYTTEQEGSIYAVFAGVPAAGENLDWKAGEEYVILEFRHDESGTGTSTFSIADDQWTAENFTGFFIELWGSDITGEIYRQSELAFVGECRFLDLRVFLEGPYEASSGKMRTELNDRGLLPATQPYHAEPWSYAGSESVESFDEDVVDWVLLEFRDADTPGAAATAGSFYSKAVLLKADGSLVGNNMRRPLLKAPDEVNQGLFVIIRHRNHVDILSNAPLSFDEGSKTFSADLSTSVDKSYGGAIAYRQIGTNLFGMAAGDGNQDQDISALDFNLWRNNAGQEGVYSNSDFDMRGNVSALDFNLWRGNAGISALPF